MIIGYRMQREPGYSSSHSQRKAQRAISMSTIVNQTYIVLISEIPQNDLYGLTATRENNCPVSQIAIAS